MASAAQWQGRERKPLAGVAVAILTVVITAACGTSPGSPGSPGPTGSGSSSTSAAVAPGSNSSAGGSSVPVPVAGGGVIALDLEHTAVLDGLGIPDLGGASMGRTFTTSFEDRADLAGFYETPQTALTHHEVTTSLAHTGTHAEKGWVTGAGALGVEPDGPNHRGYPAIQLHKLDGAAGGFTAPTLVQFWVWLDVSLQRGQWFSFATFTHDASDRWEHVVTVNLDPAGYVDIFHVPLHGQNDLALQRTDVAFPMRSWVRLTAYVDLTEQRGALAVWQGSTLIAAGRVDPRVDPTVQGVRDRTGLPPSQVTYRLEQAHFGLYAPPDVAAATVYNDDITIAELRVP